MKLNRACFRFWPRWSTKEFKSTRGLYDLLNKNVSGEILYPIVHLKGDDIEIAFTHGNQYGEEYYSFTNGQHTTQGGTHLSAFREAFVKTIREFYKKEYEAVDIRASVLAAISIKVMEPVFESQTKTKLGSQAMGPEGPTIRQFVGDFVEPVVTGDQVILAREDLGETCLLRLVQLCLFDHAVEFV